MSYKRGESGHLSEVLNSGLAEFGDLQTSIYPDHVDVKKRLHFVIKVEQRMSIDKDSKALVFTVNLNLHEGKEERIHNQRVQE